MGKIRVEYEYNGVKFTEFFDDAKKAEEFGHKKWDEGCAVTIYLRG